MEGRKFDGEKEDPTMLPIRALRRVNLVMEYGARLHARDNWRKVDFRRFLSAAMRHLLAVVKEGVLSRDPESGMLHLDHLCTSALMMLENASGEFALEDPTLAELKERADKVRTEREARG